MSFPMILRLLLLLLSLTGYAACISRRMKPELAVGFLFASVSSVLCLAGIFNVLKLAAVLILLGGLCCLFAAIRKKDLSIKLLTPGTAFFLGCSVLTVLLLVGKKFTNFDDFSHWASIVKVLLRNDRFPKWLDTTVDYQAYPLGASVLVYYVLRITGLRAEWVQMAVQAVWMAGMLSGLFSLAKTNTDRVLTGVLSLLLLFSNVSLMTLQVDTALPAAAAGALAFAVSCRGREGRMAWCLIPYLTFLVMVKNSGMLFAYLVLMAALWLWEGKGRLRRLSAMAAVPAAFFYLWIRHVKLVFTDGATSAHSMTVENFLKEAQLKQGGEIGRIGKTFLQEVFSLSNPVLWFILLGIVLAVLSSVWQEKEKRHIRILLLFAAVSYVLYQIGMFGMYILTMQQEEAVRLASYGRYHKTILIFLSGVFLSALLLFEKHRWKKLPLWAVTAAVILVSLQPNVPALLRPQSLGERRVWESLIEAYAPPKGAHCLLLLDDATTLNADLPEYIGEYLLDSDLCASVKLKYLPGALEERSDYDVLIAYEPTAPVMEYLEETYHTSERVLPMQ